VKKIKIFIQVEKDGKYVRKYLDQKMICAIFDLQFELEGYKDEIEQFFKVITFVDEAMHKPFIYRFVNETNKFIPEKKKFWLAGKPKWKKLKK
jgi:hypothetical protein